MEHETIILGQLNIENKLKSLTNVNENLWIDTITSDNWRLNGYESEMMEQEFFALEKYPINSCSKLIELLINSDSLEDIATICLIVYDREFDNDKNNRLVLMNYLEDFIENCNIEEFNRQKIRLIIYETGLYDTSNRDSISMKSINEIQNDAKFYLDIANRAKGILKKIG